MDMYCLRMPHQMKSPHWGIANDRDLTLALRGLINIRGARPRLMSSVEQQAEISIKDQQRMPQRRTRCFLLVR